MTVAIRIGDRIFEGWKSARVNMGVEQLSGAFSIEGAFDNAGTLLPIKLGDQCEVIADGEIVISGFVDKITSRYSKGQGRVIEVSGVDRTGDLTRASATPVKEWKDVHLKEVANTLLDPFDIVPEYYKVPGDKLPKFEIEQGETVLDALSRLCSYYGVLPFPNGKGGIIIGKAGGAGTFPVPLVTSRFKPSNVKEARAEASDRDRHSEYILRGEPEDWIGADDQVAQTGKYKDETFKRHCPLIVVADNVAVENDLQKRAAQMARVRRAKGFTYEYKLAGWSHSGKVWRPNYLVRVDDTELPLRDKMLISRVDLTLSKDKGSESTVQLVPIDTYTTEKTPLPSGDSDGYHL